MKTLYNKYSKTMLATLPTVAFDKRIILINNTAEAERAVDYLLAQPLLGFDTETKPSFTRGDHHSVALLQVSTLDTCFLFRLCQMDIPDCIVRLLSDRTVTKVGLSLKDDFAALRRRRDFEPGGFLDLQTIVTGFGIQDMSLQKIFANVFAKRISKSQQLTNWEADVLTDKQKTYAATDAWACVMLYNELRRLEAEGYELELTEDSTPAPQAGTGEKKKKARRKRPSRRHRRKKAAPAEAQATPSQTQTQAQ